MPDAVRYLFEDREAATLLQLLHPEKAASFLSFDDLVLRGHPLPPETPEARVGQLAQMLPEGERPKSALYLETFEKLRKAMILAVEDVDYCFAALAETPKNTLLKKIFLSYLHSPLANDWTFHVWMFMEKLKNFELENPGVEGDLVFVRGRRPSFLFAEAAKAFSYAASVSSVEVKELWEISLDSTGPSRQRRGLVVQGSATTTLSRLGEQVARLISRGSDPSHIHLAFQGAPHLADFLSYQLDHYRIPYRQLLPRAKQKPVPSAISFPQILEAIRGDGRRELKDRLKVSALLIDDGLGRRSKETWGPYFDKLVRLKKLSAEDGAYLQAITEGPAKVKEPETPSSGVALVPFALLPLPAGHTWLGFADESLMQPEATETLLRPGELESLHQAGFALGRPTDARTRTSALWSALATPSSGRRLLFTSLARKVLSSEVRHFALAERRPTVADPVKEESFHVAVPERKLSATQLETYARCPALYYFSNRLRLQRSDAPERRYPLVFGQAAHLALEWFFQAHPKSTLEDEALTETSLMELFAKTLAQLAPSLEATQPLHLILTENFRKVARKISGLEKQLQIVAGGSSPVAFERPFEINVAGITFRGKIDRIDETADGAVLILDYKTGNVDFTPNHIVQGSHFQALLYLLAAEQLFTKPCAGLLFYDLKKGELRRGILRNEKVSGEAKKAVTRGHVLIADKFQEIRDQGVAHLTEIARHINDGNYPAKPTPAICDSCDYAGMCRHGAGYV